MEDTDTGAGIGMMAHDAILVLRTDETRFLSVMGTEVKMVLDTSIKLERFAQPLQRQDAIEIDPLPAAFRPSLATKGLTKSRIQ